MKDDVKIGAGHASAMFRQGFREVRAALYPDSNVAAPTEYGIYGTKLPSEIAEERHGAVVESKDDNVADRDSILGNRMKEIESRDHVDRDPKEPDLDR